LAKARPSKKRQSAKTVGYVLYLLFALGIGSVAGWLGQSSLIRDIPRAVFHRPEEFFENKKSVVLLLLGCDEDRFFKGTLLHGSPISRQYARSDMMLLTRIDFDTKKITGISIPRDTLFGFPGKKKRKINGYFSIAPFSKRSPVPILAQRAALTQRAVEGLLPGVHIDQSIVLNFEAFKSLIDLVGGIDIDVPQKMDYEDKAGDLYIHLKPGLQHLNGDQAMGFVRFRHDRESDFGRQARQKAFLLAFKAAVMQNIKIIPQIADSGKKVFNESLNNDQILALFNFSRGVPQTSIQMGMVPVLEKGSNIVLDESKVDATLRQYGFIN